mgnify:CR=1 FL=1
MNDEQENKIIELLEKISTNQEIQLGKKARGRSCNQAL